MTGSKDPIRSGRDSRATIVAVAAVALLVGAALGPSAAGAAAAALVQVKNWPAVQKVKVVNLASDPAYTQPPAHTTVNLRGGAQILKSGTTAEVPFYTVPADKWLVITSIDAEGYGTGPIDYAVLGSHDGNIHMVVPITLTSDAGLDHLSSAVAGVHDVPPGTALTLTLLRETGGAGIWNVGVWADGYLTDRP